MLAPVQHHPEPAAFDALVLGGAVHSGRWLEPAPRYADVASPLLRSRLRGCPGLAGTDHDSPAGPADGVGSRVAVAGQAGTR